MSFFNKRHKRIDLEIAFLERQNPISKKSASESIMVLPTTVGCPFIIRKLNTYINIYASQKLLLENKATAEAEGLPPRKKIDVYDKDEVAPFETKLQNEEKEENEQGTKNPLARMTSSKSTELAVQASTKLKDLFTTREEEEMLSN